MGSLTAPATAANLELRPRADFSSSATPASTTVFPTNQPTGSNKKKACRGGEVIGKVALKRE